jgi:hypothetical protein
MAGFAVWAGETAGRRQRIADRVIEKSGRRITEL